MSKGKLISILLFAISLFLVPFYINEGEIHYLRELSEDHFSKNGFVLLLFGWGYLNWIGGLGFIWLANPLLVVSWWISNKKVSFVFALASFILAISFLFYNEIVTINNTDYIMPNGKKGLIEYAELELTALGYWVWLSSILINLIFYFKALRSEKTNY